MPIIYIYLTVITTTAQSRSVSFITKKIISCLGAHNLIVISFLSKKLLVKLSNIVKY